MSRTPLLPDWIAAEITGGRTQLQHMLDTSPFDRAALRTVAQSCDFEVIDGYVRRVFDCVDTWFPQHEPLIDEIDQGVWAFPVTITSEMIDGAHIPVPRAIGAIVQVRRQGHLSLSSRLGPQAVAMTEDQVRTASIRRFIGDLDLQVGDTARLIFTSNGIFDVTS